MQKSVVLNELSSIIPDAGQLLYVAVTPQRCQVFCLDRRADSCWEPVGHLGGIPANVGRNGIRADKHEGDGCTPAGCFRLGYAFGCREKPETRLQYRPVTSDSWWVDDPASRYYNTWVEGYIKGGWSSAEHLSEFPKSYAYAAVIEYNMNPVLPGKGSAVFLHCGSKPTAGCVAVRASALLSILKWLDPAKSPAIYIAAE